MADYYIVWDKTLPHLAPHTFCVSDDLFYNVDEAYEALYSELPKKRVVSRSVDYADRPKDVNFYNYCMYWKTPNIEYTEADSKKDLANIRKTYKHLLDAMWVEETKEEIDEFMKQVYE